MFTFSFMALCVYQITASNTIPNVMRSIGLKSWTEINHFRLIQILATTTFLLPLALARDLKSLRYASLAGVFFVIYLIVVHPSNSPCLAS